MKIYLIILSLLCIYCCGINKSNQESTYGCNENLKFKTEFFKNIKSVDDYMTLLSTTNFKNFEEYKYLVTEEKYQNFKLSLNFIHKYSSVSFESMNNYDGGYPLDAYWKDKEVWLKWYEENKCRNIQFKE